MRALEVLTAINLLNYLDRYVVAPLAAGSEERHVALAMRSSARCWSAFILVYMVAAPVFGAWGDRGSRTRPIALGIGIWSLATMLSGLAHGYPHLLAARALVGIGEASFVAIAPSLLADLFAAQGRGARVRVLNMAIPVGAALGYVVGGPGAASTSAGARRSSSPASRASHSPSPAVAAGSAARRPGPRYARQPRRSCAAVASRMCSASTATSSRAHASGWSCSAMPPTLSPSAGSPTGCRRFLERVRGIPVPARRPTLA